MAGDIDFYGKEAPQGIQGKNEWERMAKQYAASLEQLSKNRTEYVDSMGKDACSTLVEISILAESPFFAAAATAIEYLPAGEESPGNVLKIHRDDARDSLSPHRAA